MSEPWTTSRLVSEDPEFGAPIANLTTPVGREAVLSCSVDRLGKYKVIRNNNYYISYYNCHYAISEIVTKLKRTIVQRTKQSEFIPKLIFSNRIFSNIIYVL